MLGQLVMSTTPACAVGAISSNWLHQPNNKCESRRSTTTCWRVKHDSTWAGPCLPDRAKLLPEAS